MTQKICKEMDEIMERILKIHDIDDVRFQELCDKVATMSTQIAVQKCCDDILKLVEKGEALPVRRISFNIKKLSDGCEQSEPRWQRLQTLQFNGLILCMLSFPGLVSLPSDQFNWLIDNTDRYLQAQGFSTNFIEIDQIRKIVANAPRQENTKIFHDSTGCDILNKCA
jgi:hypothetical protein